MKLKKMNKKKLKKELKGRVKHLVKIIKNNTKYQEDLLHEIGQAALTVANLKGQLHTTELELDAINEQSIRDDYRYEDTIEAVSDIIRNLTG